MKNFRKWATVTAWVGFAVLELRPRRIFTPNGDGVNDQFKICFDNPSDAVISVSQVFDLSGREAGTLQQGVSADPTCSDFLFWDGRDRGGRKAAGGLYLYKVEADQATFTGMLVLAR